ncbi:MAG: hypothetical protein ACI9HB_002409, partial [Gammaproteobacteria bacterium]
ATYANGDIYEGTFVRGRRQGVGTMRYTTGEEATGEWIDGALPVANVAPAVEDPPADN